MKDAWMKKMKVQEVSFQEADLSGASLFYALLSDCIFKKRTLVRAMIHGLVDQRCDWSGANKKDIITTDPDQQAIDDQLTARGIAV